MAAGALVMGISVLAPIAFDASPAAADTQPATFSGGLSCDEWRAAVAPAGATSVTFEITGGGGSSGDPSGGWGGRGGRGGIVKGTYAVQGGQRIWAVVGCGGNGWHAGTAKGYAYGGDPGHPVAGGGGAASAICLGTVAPQCSGGEVLAIAGGGGGGGMGDASGRNGGPGGNVSTANAASANGGTTAGSNNSTENSNGNATNGGGGEQAKFGLGARNDGTRGIGGNGAIGNRGQGGDGGNGPASGVVPPTALGVIGSGGLAYNVNNRGGGGGGGGLAGGGAGGTGMNNGTNQNAGAGGGAGSSWYKSGVSAASFGQAGGTNSACSSTEFARNGISATNAGFGAPGTGDAGTSGGNGCSGFVSVTWTFTPGGPTPVSSDNNTWLYTPPLNQSCDAAANAATLPLPSSTTDAAVVAVGGGGGGGGGGSNNAYGGAGGHGATASLGWSSVRSGGSLIASNLNWQVGCGGKRGTSQNSGSLQLGGDGGGGYATGGSGGQTNNGSDRRASGGGGGGATAVCLGASASACNGAGTQLAIAGGGGGGGGSSYHNDANRSSGGGIIRPSGTGQASLDSDTGQTGLRGGVSRGGYGGGRGRKASGAGGGGGGTSSAASGDSDSTSDGTAGTGSAAGGARGNSRSTGTPVAAEAAKGTNARDGGNGGYHNAGSTRKSAGGGGGGGLRGGGGGGGDEESGGNPGGGGGGSGSSWVNTSLASSEGYSFAVGAGINGFASTDADRPAGAGGTPGERDSTPPDDGVAGLVRVTLRGQAISLAAAPSAQSSVVDTSVSVSPVVQGTNFTFQDPSNVATCACTYTAAGLPPGLTMSSAGVVTGTPTTHGSYPVTVRITSSGGTYTNTTSAFTWVVRRASATAVSCVPGTISYDQQSSCTVTVSDTSSGTKVTPTGSIVFFAAGAGSGSFGTCTLAQSVLGTATCVASGSFTSQDTYSVTVTHAQTSVHVESASVATNISVRNHSTSTSVSCSPSSLVAGSPSTCTATVTDTQAGVTKASPTGTVVFGQSGGGTFDSTTCALVAGVSPTSSCSVQFTPTFGGAKTVTASFDGFSSGTAAGGFKHRSSSAVPVSLTVTGSSAQHPTTTSVSCSPNPVQVLTGTTCTAIVTDTMTFAATATPTGTVNFAYSGGGTLSPTSCTLAVNVVNVSAKCSVTFTPNAIAGSKTVQANYAGVPVKFKASGSGSIFVTATAAPVTPPPAQVQHPTTTSVNCSPSTLPLGNASTCTVTVTDTYEGTTSSPAGTVSFGSSGGGTLSAPTCTLQASGDGKTSTCQVAFTPTGAKGSKTVIASYAGTPQVHKASGSGSFYLTAT